MSQNSRIFNFFTPTNPNSKLLKRQSAEENSTPEQRPKIETHNSTDPSSTEHDNSPNAMTEPVSRSPLQGLSFVLSGQFIQTTKSRLTDVIKDNGGTISGSVSKKTNYVFEGKKTKGGKPYAPGAAIKKAQTLGTKIMDENAFSGFLEELLEMEWDDIARDPNAPKEIERTQEKIEPMMPPSQVKLYNGVLSRKVETSDPSQLLWADRYVPRSLKEYIIDKKTLENVTKWLKNWENVNIHGNKNDCKGKFDPKSNTNAKAALLTGSPGIGKTTLARMIGIGMTYAITELNASDIRSKNAILTKLNSIKDNRAIYQGDKIVRSMLIMDEVDGMSSGDRGGIAALIEIIKKTKIPIICIANDRQSQKLTSLANHCFDIRFRKPNIKQVMTRLQQIWKAERCVVDDASLENVVNSSGCDIRQSINLLELWSRGQNKANLKSEEELDRVSKDATSMISNFDAAGVLLNRQRRKGLKNKDLLDLFFIDFDLIPLFVQEHYLDVHKRDNITIDCAAEAADSIAFADTISNRMRGGGEWSLLRSFAQASTIHPCMKSDTNVSYVQFPSWFGKYSKERKNKRLVKEARGFFASSTSSDDVSLVSQFVPLIYKILIQQLIKGDAEQWVRFMYEYNITPAQFQEHLIQLHMDIEKAENDFKNVPKATKGQLTKLYNTLHKSSVGKTKKKRAAGKIADKYDPEIEDPPNEESEEEVEEEDVIKPAKPAAAGRKKK